MIPRDDQSRGRRHIGPEESKHVVIAFVAMLTMSVLGYMVSRLPTSSDSFVSGVQAGFLDRGLSSSVINAILFSLIAACKTSRWTLAGSVVLILIATEKCVHYCEQYEGVGPALVALSPTFLSAAVLSPSSWVMYFLTYRALKPPTARVGE